MIEINSLSKSFKTHKKEPGLKGSLKSLFYREEITKVALKSINLKINKGEIIGLIGANGAGKTTLVKILAGIVHPTAGSATVLGHIPWKRPNEYRKKMSLIMGQKNQVWWDLPALDSFLLLKEIYQIPTHQYQRNIEFLAETLMIKDQLKTQVRKLSLGERMKIELMAALLHNPEVIFLDEPTIGLDISAQKAVRQFLLEYQKEYSPITILTSHYMEDIKELCPRIAIMKQGDIVFDGPLTEVQKMLGDQKVITVTTEEKTFKLHIPRSDLAQETQKIFLNDNVIDLNIQDPPIEEIIESLMRNGSPI